MLETHVKHVKRQVRERSKDEQYKESYTTMYSVTSYETCSGNLGKLVRGLLNNIIKLHFGMCQ